MIKGYFNCVCGNKIELFGLSDAFTADAYCKSCGRPGTCILQKEELYFNSDDSTLKELEGRGLKKVTLKGWPGSWIKIKDWTSSE